MRNNIIQLQEIDKNKNYLGNKTLNLKKCVDWGFNVPQFVAIPSFISKELLSNQSLRNKVVEEIRAVLKNEKYAVRSSALIEDGVKQSLAGQFLTKTNIGSTELDQSIIDVLTQANVYLKGDLDAFSIIIQEYIASDISGVTFTRNPNGNREMILEYGFCEGEKIVSGAIKPEKLIVYWNDTSIETLQKSKRFVQAIEVFKELECKNSFPQDIEWCIKNDQFYVLQTRPITTITINEYEGIIFLENALSKRSQYYFEKTELSEIAPRPSTITHDLLSLIYSKDGPVDKVYRTYGVDYTDTSFIKIIGNELFVDKDKEIQGLLPSYSYLSNKNFTPTFNRFSKSLVTMRNLFCLNKIKTKGYEQLFDKLKNKIEETKQDNLDCKTALKKFLNDYELIFEINLLSGLSLKKLGIFIKNEGINFSEIIDGSSCFVDLRKYRVQYHQNIKGNSLEISDESVFLSSQDTETKKNEKVEIWWGKMPEYKKNFLRVRIIESIIYNRLRELGRWLTIININALRSSLLVHAKNHEFINEKNIFFSHLDDALSNRNNESDCINNKSVYEKYNIFSFPNTITSSFVSRDLKILGVSSGITSGILLSREAIDGEISEYKKVILYTEILSPDLTKYFDKIVGILSNNGSMLSHLAIVAREKNIPVIVGFSIVGGDIKIGDNVQIDGDSGKILKS